MKKTNKYRIKPHDNLSNYLTKIKLEDAEIKKILGGNRATDFYWHWKP